MKNVTLYIFFVILSVSACDNSSIENAADLSEISSIEWQLHYISEDGFGVTAPPMDSLYTITFSEEGISIRDHCNVCGGEVSLNDGEIEITGLLCTLAACSYIQPAINFSNEITNVKIAQLVDGELQLTYKKNGKNRTFHFTNPSNTSLEKVIMAGEESFDRDNWANGPYSVADASIEDDILTLTVGYSGCSPHQFDMVFTNYFLESNPVQANAILPNISEACRAFFQTTHSFDLAPLKKSYQESYGKSGSINIRFSEDYQETFYIEYEF